MMVVLVLVVIVMLRVPRDDRLINYSDWAITQKGIPIGYFGFTDFFDGMTKLMNQHFAYHIHPDIALSYRSAFVVRDCDGVML